MQTNRYSPEEQLIRSWKRKKMQQGDLGAIIMRSALSAWEETQMDL